MEPAPLHPATRRTGAPARVAAPRSPDDVLRMLALVLRGDAAGLRETGGPDWAACAAMAREHGLSPLLYHHAQALAAEWPLPPEQAQALHDNYLVAAVDGRASLDAAASALARLAEAGIEVVVLKGLHLVAAVYESPALRRMLDIDLLVRPEQLEAARAALLAAGYASEDVDDPTLHHAARLVKPRTPPVELHHALSPDRSPFRIVLERLRARAVPITVGAQPALGLCAEDLLLHLCLHLAYNHRCLVPLRNVYDVAGVIEWAGTALRWELLEETARASGTRRAVFCGLGLARDLFAAEVPAALLERLAPAADRDAVLRAARENVMAYTASGPYWMGMALGDARPARTVGGILGRVFAPPDRLLETSGRTVSRAKLAWIYLTRPAVLAYRHRRLLADLLLARPGARAQLRLARSGAALESWIAGADR